MRRSTLAAFLVLATACGGKPTPTTGGGGAGTGVATGETVDTPELVAKKPAPAYRQVTAAETLTTAWQATVTIPASWYVADDKDAVYLQDPERELSLWLLTSQAADRDAAIAESWAKVVPGFDLAVAQAQGMPGSDGWDAMAQVVYVTPTDEARGVVAFVRKKAETWHIALIDGKNAAFDRRGAQLNSIIADMKVPGVDEESFAGKPALIDAAHLATWSEFVEEARVLEDVPGIAVAVVHGGKIIFEQGYGVRSRADKKPKKVTPSTVFMIGSTTKSLTTVLLARLVDQGKLGWDTLVTTVLPQFALADAAITQQVRVEHTVCACTGMPRQDYEFLFEFDGWDPEERLASMATMKPTTGFGETFQYSNTMVATGGWIAAHIYAPKQKLGAAYDAAMQKLVFGPLGMKTATFDFKKAQKGDHALPHASGFSTTYAPSPLSLEKAVYAVRPAGGAWASVRDLARYVMLELANGKLDGKQVVSEANLLERRKPRVAISGTGAYGLGLFLSTDYGINVVHHGGNMIGYTADLFMLPEHDLGVIVLTNAGQANALRSAVRRRFLEVIFDGKPEAKANLAEGHARGEEQLAEELKLHAAPDEAWITPLLGGYDNHDLGHLELRKTKAGGYEVDAGEWQSGISKKTDRDGTVKIITATGAFAGLELVPRVQDGKAVLALEAGQHTYVFVPTAPKQ